MQINPRHMQYSIRPRKSNRATCTGNLQPHTPTATLNAVSDVIVAPGKASSGAKLSRAQGSKAARGNREWRVGDGASLAWDETWRNATPGKCEWSRRPMRQVEDHLNSSAFAAIHGKGLMGLAKELWPPCEELIRRQGARLSK